jgi:hypothetical protein
MKISDINPHIRVAIPSVITADIKKRVIFDYELIYVEEGEFVFEYDSVSYNCKGGDIIFICPGIPHSFTLNGKEVSQPHIHFDISYRPESDIIPISFKDVGDMSEKEKNFIHKNYFKKHQKTPFLYIKETDRFLEMFYAAIQARSSKDNLSAKGILITLVFTYALIINPP